MTSHRIEDIEYRSLAEIHLDDATKLLTSAMLQREPLISSLDNTSYNVEYSANYQLCQRAIRDGLSFVAIDTSTNKLVGVAASVICTEGEEGEYIYYAKDLKGREVYTPMLAILGVLHGHGDPIAGITTTPSSLVAEIAKVTTHVDYGRMGILTEITRRKLEVCKEKGLSIVMADATSPYSQRAFEKCGFHSVYEIQFDNFEFEGKKLFSNHPVAKCVQLMVKQL
ncbi:uncharacterized protein LOC102804860 [Saccoglossus kowalevskii]|uniref:Uncharacterized protein LOC102804860 n=1 Tax=Saccoglossus kowalevskii TaxID=10224 RepID=A0ABM0MIV5_SACKO|nr:PREDICTED: uncharacterized protein LOC102804860 [Saccoglossus kowalevskii]